MPLAGCWSNGFSSPQTPLHPRLCFPSLLYVGRVLRTEPVHEIRLESTPV
jgi:hypothetical protein